MDARISEIQIAGAGSGKTYGLAERTIVEYQKLCDHKKVFAITFTNSASKNISDNIMHLLGSIPNEIEISTVHTFFLNEIVYPYSKLITGKEYSKAVSIPLHPKPSYKNSKLRFLNERNIIHNEQVYKKTHFIVKKKGKTKALKSKIDVVYQHLRDSIAALMVDEAQDLDADALNVIKTISDIGVRVYIVGDPKQAIKYPNTFNSFIDDCGEDIGSSFEILECNNETRRIPERHLKLSNIFCPENQIQYPNNDHVGRLGYMYVNDARFDEIFKAIKKANGHIYIRQSNERFATKKRNGSALLPYLIRDRLERISTNRFIDFETWVDTIFEELKEDAMRFGSKKAISNFTNKYGFRLTEKEYAQLSESLSSAVVIPHDYEVISIDKVKGLEADSCLFIVDNVMTKYLVGKETEVNKEHHRLYVALTRSRKNLILAFDSDRINSVSIEAIDEKMSELQIKRISVKKRKTNT